MIILDTNIVSELMKTTPATKVLDWLDNQAVTQLFITTITIAEISYGIKALPLGERRSNLETAFEQAMIRAFKHRILNFNETAATLYGTLMSDRKKIGRPLGIIDAQIAAIALEHQAVLATRNTRDFSDCQLELINPF